MSGTKFDSEKADWSLLDLSALEPIVRVLMYGAKKYARSNWMGVAPYRYWNALIRHLAAWYGGENVDAESGLHHLAHAGTNMFFLLWMLANGELKPSDVRDATVKSPQGTTPMDVNAGVAK